MSNLMDKIRSMLGGRGRPPRETSETYGAPRPEDSVPPLGEPTPGSVTDLPLGDEPSQGPTKAEPGTGSQA